MITTKQFNLTPNGFFKVLLSIYLKKRWWLLLLIVTIAAMALSPGFQDGTFLIAIAVLYPILVVYRFWKFANDKENAVLYVTRHYEINQEEIIGFFENGSEGRIKLYSVIKYIELKDCYMLYISKTQFIYISKAVFYSNHDKAWFNNNVLYKIKKW